MAGLWLNLRHFFWPNFLKVVLIKVKAKNKKVKKVK